MSAPRELLATTRSPSLTNSEVMLLHGTNADYGLKTQAWRLNLMRQCKQVDKLAVHKTKQRHRWRLHVS